MLYNLLVEDRRGEALQKVFDVVEEQVKIELERKSDDNPS